MKDILENNLTIIIPTYKRHSYLERVLEFYKINKFTNIIVADSTLEIFPKLDEYRVNYKHYPNISFSEKMIDVFESISTPYCVVCADDDFIFVDALTKCIEFLNKHQDYVSCSGTFVTFYTEYLLNYNFINLGVNEYKNYSNKDLFDRIDFHFSNYYTLMYSVHRTNIFKTFLNEFYDINQPFLREVAQSFYTLSFGKNEVLPIFYGARECMKGESEGQTSDNLEIVMRGKKYEDEYKRFYKKIFYTLKNNCKLDNITTKNTIDSAITSYLNMCIVNKKLTIKTTIKKMFSFFDYLRKKKRYKTKSLSKLKVFTPEDNNLQKWYQIEKLVKKYK